MSWRKLRNFSELHNELQTNLEDIITQVEMLLPKEIYSRADVIQELDITSEELNNDILTQNTVHLMEFKLRQRALHVFEGTRQKHDITREVADNIYQYSSFM